MCFRLTLASALALMVLLPNAALANRKACLNLEQSYEQIQRSATTIEINDVLFSAADKGCAALARPTPRRRRLARGARPLRLQPLAHAAAAGKTEIVTLFIDRGAPIDARSLDGSTALYKAAETGRLDDRSTLGRAGRRYEPAGRSGITPLSAAAYMGSEPIVTLPDRQRRRPQCQDDTKKARDRLRRRPRLHPVTRLLLDHGVDVNARYGNDLTVLMWAAGYSAEAGVNDIVQGHQPAARSRRDISTTRTIAAARR